MTQSPRHSGCCKGRVLANQTKPNQIIQLCHKLRPPSACRRLHRCPPQPPPALQGSQVPSAVPGAPPHQPLLPPPQAVTWHQRLLHALARPPALLLPVMPLLVLPAVLSRAQQMAAARGPSQPLAALPGLLGPPCGYRSCLGMRWWLGRSCMISLTMAAQVRGYLAS